MAIAVTKRRNIELLSDRKNIFFDTEMNHDPTNYNIKKKIIGKSHVTLPYLVDISEKGTTFTDPAFILLVLSGPPF